MSFTRRPGSGRSRQTSLREDHNILRNARVQPIASSAALQAHVAPSLGAPVSSRTIQRCPAEGHLGSWRPLCVLPLTPTHRRLRLEWFRARGNWTSGREPATYPPTAVVMVWGVIAYLARSSLVLIRGTSGMSMTGAILQQDNARPYTARVSEEYLRTVTTLPWTARSPDLSPIEHICDHLGRCQVIYSQFGLAIHQNDHQARRRFVEWAQNEVAVAPDFHKRILFSDEAHFWLNGYVNKQNCRIWSEANPQVYVETPLHPEKLTLWCALWAGGIIGPYFFKNDEGHNVTVNGDRYRAMITNFFIPELNNHDVQELWF
ncbi:transposable element Tcb2 transposase [Trichonephila clavipes]|nr:transposable element Tcb2 transposase [Trichonephila clavipes]